MIVAQTSRVFNAMNENEMGVKPAFPHYSVTSRTTSEGIRAHTVKTKSAHIANLFFGAALDFDDEPLLGKNGGTYTVYFYADDTECDTVIMAATGGKA